VPTGVQEEAANIKVIRTGVAARLIGEWRSAAAQRCSVHQRPGTSGCAGTRMSWTVRLRARVDAARGVGAGSAARPRGSGDAEAAWLGERRGRCEVGKHRLNGRGKDREGRGKALTFGETALITGPPCSETSDTCVTRPEQRERSHFSPACGACERDLLLAQERWQPWELSAL
jgi:hypothetical protein